MTVIRPNSVSGINSITAQADEIKVFKSNGTQGGLIIGGANLNATTGISTILALNVTGNVSIAGTLTYQDVTNVDSLGIGTFRTGINVSGGQVDVGSNIKLGNAGGIRATSFRGSGANLTGLAAGGIASLVADTSPQLGGNLDSNSRHILLNDTARLKCGAGEDLQIFHEGTNSYINNLTGSLYIRGVDEKHIFIQAKSGENSIVCKDDEGVELYYDNVKKFETLADGAVFDGDNVSEIKISDDGDGFLNSSGAAVIAKGYFDYSGAVTGFYTNTSGQGVIGTKTCLLYTSPSPRDS